MQPGDDVVSKRHQGLIRLVILYTKGGGIGRKLKRDGTPGRQEVCLKPGDVVIIRPCLPGCKSR